MSNVSHDSDKPPPGRLPRKINRESINRESIFGFRLAGHYDWSRVIHRSGLPTDVCELIRGIAKETRLTRAEKYSVVNELVAHFQDGAERGRPFDQLISEFGNPQQTAELIRINKVRNRSMFEKYGKAFIALGVTASAAYIFALIYFYLGKPEPSVDYLAEFNQPIESMAEEDKAWNVYRDVWAKFEFSEGINGQFREMHYTNPEDPADGRLIRTGDEGWDVAVNKLKDSAELLECFREGARRLHLGVPLFADRSRYSREDRLALFPNDDPDEIADASLGNDGLSPEADRLLAGSMIGVLLPHIQSFRKAARILVVDSRWASQQEDLERIVVNIETIMGLARQAADADILVCGLVGIAVNGIGNDLIDEMLAGQPDRFSAEQLTRIQTAIESVDVNEMLSFRGEELMIKDLIQRTYTNDGKGDGRMTSSGFELIAIYKKLFGLVASDGEQKEDWSSVLKQNKFIGGPIALVNASSRKEVTEDLESLIEQLDLEFQKPYWEQPKFEADSKRWEGTNEGVFLEEIPRMTALIHNTRERCLANRAGMLFAIAAHRYRLKHGSWPTSSEDLVGTLLNEETLDRINGDPLRCTTVDGEFRIYSIGHDRDDDAGRSIKMTKDHRFQPPKVDPEQWEVGHEMIPVPAGEFTFTFPPYLDGDWVIWPRRSEL